MFVALGSLIFSGCVPGNPTVAIDPDAPNFRDPLPSPTPTFSAPDPDDKDPIADCALDAPICQVGFGLQDLVGIRTWLPTFFYARELSNPARLNSSAWTSNLT